MNSRNSSIQEKEVAVKMVTLGFPRTVFPFRSISQRLTLEYDEIDQIMDELFQDIFEQVPEQTPADQAEQPQPIAASAA